ncbi:hypothetical protein [Mycetocola saprophilus]|uniref:hypothetical protein n=1 Tax=Mycetocola saprophilus TaxID=76636 RepID=UPI003BF1A82A
MAGISIDINSNARDFVRGTKDAETALEDVADALDDLARDAKKSSDKTGDALADGIEDGLKDAERVADRAGKRIGDNVEDGVKAGTKDAEKSVEKLEASFSDLAAASKRETTTAGQAVKKNVGEAARDTSEAVSEIKDEAISNLSEVVSSFDGSASSIADLVQGTFGGLVSSLGPLGMGIGAAAALGIGLWVSQTEGAAEATEEFRSRVGELAQEYIETGKTGETSLDFMIDRLKEAAATADDSTDSLSELRRIAKTAGTDFRTLSDAYAGNAKGLDEVIKAQEKRRDQLQKERIASDGVNLSLEERMRAQIAVIDTLTQARDAAKDAEAATEAYAAAGGPEMEARRDQIDAVSSALQSSIGVYSDFDATEEKAIDPAGYLAAMKARQDATVGFSGNVQKLAQDFDLSSDEVQAILDEGLDFAPMLAAIMNSGMAPQFVEQVRNAVGGGEKVLDGAGLTAKIEAKADTKPVADDLKKTADTKREAKIEVKADPSPAEKALADLAGKKRTAKIDVTVDTADASAALDRFVNRARKITVQVEARTRDGQQVL